MTTPNGHEAHDPNGPDSAGQSASSTVLALDGWGPIEPEPPSNGANGVQPEPLIEAVEPLPVEPPIAAPSARFTVREAAATFSMPTIAVDGQLIRILASAAAMTLAVLLAEQFSNRLRALAATQQTEPAPLTGVARLRRQVALTVDPSLAPTPQRTLRSLRFWD